MLRSFEGSAAINQETKSTLKILVTKTIEMCNDAHQSRLNLLKEELLRLVDNGMSLSF